QRIDALLNKEVKSVKDLREQTNAMVKLRNEINIETKEGQAQIKLLNSQIDANTEAVKENVSGMEQQKMSIGGYTEAITKAIGGTDLFSNELGQLSQISSGINSLMGVMQTQLKGVTTATTLTTASLKLLRLALIGTGIGAILVLLGSFVAY